MRSASGQTSELIDQIAVTSSTIVTDHPRYCTYRIYGIIGTFGQDDNTN